MADAAAGMNLPSQRSVAYVICCRTEAAVDRMMDGLRSPGRRRHTASAAACRHFVAAAAAAAAAAADLSRRHPHQSVVASITVHAAIHSSADIQRHKTITAITKAITRTTNEFDDLV